MEKSFSVMRIAIIGSRGIPASYGGFETFVEEISTRLSSESVDVTVVCQKGDAIMDSSGSVKLKYSRFTKDKKPVRFYYDSLKIASADADIILVCGVGGSIFYPLLKKSRTKFITHVDGREELRGKYSRLKKIYVRISQAFAAKYSDHIIADSNAVKKYWQIKYALPEKKISAIGFGAHVNFLSDNSILSDFGLSKKSYHLVVCRMVPENNLEMIIDGFGLSASKSKLILVGELSGGFGERLRKYSSEQIRFVGGVYDKSKLYALREHCNAYLHGHSVGGTNPSLLEAMAAGNICVCNDNEFNRETTDNEALYFRNAEELAEKIIQVEGMSEESRKSFGAKGRSRISSVYNWDNITNKYKNLFSTFHSI
jgi:glycosyltransferase involved in cell wall biosynthesis